MIQYCKLHGEYCHTGCGIRARDTNATPLLKRALAFLTTNVDHNAMMGCYYDKGPCVCGLSALETDIINLLLKEIP